MQPADAGGEDGAEAAGFDTDRVEAAGLLERLGGCGQGELFDAVCTSGLLRVLEEGGRVPVLDFERASTRRARAEQPDQ